MSRICWPNVSASSCRTKPFGISMVREIRPRSTLGVKLKRATGSTRRYVVSGSEVFVTINGQRQYLWRAVDQDGDLIRRSSSNPVGTRYCDLRRGDSSGGLLNSQRQEPCELVTDKLGSYRVMPTSGRHARCHP